MNIEAIKLAIAQHVAELKAAYPNHCPHCEGRGGYDEDVGNGYPDWVTCSHCLFEGLDPLNTNLLLLSPEGETEGFDPTELFEPHELRECISPTTGEKIDFGFYQPVYRLAKLRKLLEEVQELERRKASLEAEYKELCDLPYGVEGRKGVGIPTLLRELTQLSNTHYGEGTQMKIPFMGGFIELDLEFNNNLINVISATCYYLGEQIPHNIKTGYTSDIQLARQIQETLSPRIKRGEETKHAERR